MNDFSERLLLMPLVEQEANIDSTAELQQTVK